MSEHITLKPCPFCGSKNVFLKGNQHYYGYFVMCDYCLTSGDNYKTSAIAAEEWNRKAYDESKID